MRAGVRAAGGFSLTTVLIKLLPLLAVVLARSCHARRDGRRSEPLRTPVSLANIAAAAALTLFAMLGFECATPPVGKVVDDPKRTCRGR